MSTDNDNLISRIAVVETKADIFGQQIIQINSTAEKTFQLLLEIKERMDSNSALLPILDEQVKSLSTEIKQLALRVNESEKTHIKFSLTQKAVIAAIGILGGSLGVPVTDMLSNLLK